MPNPYIPFILPNDDLIDINKIINKLSYQKSFWVRKDDKLWKDQ